jgi:hypothetical protein
MDNPIIGAEWDKYCLDVIMVPRPRHQMWTVTIHQRKGSPVIKHGSSRWAPGCHTASCLALTLLVSPICQVLRYALRVQFVYVQLGITN